MIRRRSTWSRGALAGTSSTECRAAQHYITRRAANDPLRHEATAPSNDNNKLYYLYSKNT